ncbi:hypothetical protein HYC85_023720 [Camellia sinensis]|uniref:GPI ethanolamine phosphate transferase 3 n=1 Tax=Camellia sinensis TaxID=4442 RepID=A0A7J7GHS2_CAMSI|nr:hypothetical protein HYC85_023720 [Camellia sinensis]
MSYNVNGVSHFNQFTKLAPITIHEYHNCRKEEISLTENDHAGHIFGVNSIPMTEKLDQYNNVVEMLESQSGPGGLHENTLLLVMGDHGQTINGDHGGGTAEEVETAIFAMGLKKPPSSLLLEHDTSSCQLDLLLVDKNQKERVKQVNPPTQMMVGLDPKSVISCPEQPRTSAKKSRINYPKTILVFSHIDNDKKSLNGLGGESNREEDETHGLLKYRATFGMKWVQETTNELMPIMWELLFAHTHSPLYTSFLINNWFGSRIPKMNNWFGSSIPKINNLFGSRVPNFFHFFDIQLPNDGRLVCISSIQQIDFAVTVSALLGVPFPFGSIGRVNPELYALASGTWNFESSKEGIYQNQSNTEEWMQNYVNVLCINSWQVKRYIDVYSASSLIGFSNEDLLHLSAMYSQAMENWSNTMINLLLHKNESCHTSLPDLRRQTDAYFSFLASVAELARSKWTEFNLKMMGIGFGVILTSLLVHLLAIRRLDKLCGVHFLSHAESGISFGLTFSCLVVWKKEKSQVFLLPQLGCSTYAVVFVLLISILRFTIELGLSKQAVSSVLLDICPSWIAELVPVLALVVLAFMLLKSIAHSSCKRIIKYVIIGTILSYLLIAAYWASESKLLNLPLPKGIRRNFIPQIIYIIGCAQLSSLALLRFLTEEKTPNWEENLVFKMVAMLSAWSSTVIILSGRQGPLVALASIIGGWCIMRLKSFEQDCKNGTPGTLSLYSSPVTQWSLIAVCLFFCTGHWCAFDGLHYAAAFIGFEEFILVPQAILLSIDTFGFSHILPIFGLPFLVARQLPFGQGEQQRKRFFFMQLSQVYLMYGFITAISITFTILCVTIQRRHLMVWGLFAPKFVFDVAGLILTDVLIFLAVLYYDFLEQK